MSTMDKKPKQEQQESSFANTAQEVVRPAKPERSAKELAKQAWHDLEQEEKRMVRGKFIYHECPNGIMEFNFRKYKNDELKRYSLKDGETYEIPLSVARHLNSNCSYDAYNYKNNEAGQQIQVKEKVRRTAFQSLDFF